MRLSLALAGMLFLGGCAADVGEGRVAAEVVDAPAAPATPAAAKDTTGVTVYKLDKAASKVGALGAKVTAQHPIDFKDFEANVGVKDGKLASLEYTVQMGTLEADHPKLTTHLKDADFFDVATFPTSTFVSTEIKEGSETEGATHTVSGDLTIRGTTKRVTFPATLAVADGKAEAQAEFVIDRRDFKVIYPGRPDDLVKNNVALNIAFVANAPAS